MRWYKQSALYCAQQTRCCCHYYWKKSIIRISTPSESPVPSIPSQTLPSGLWVFWTTHMTTPPPSLCQFWHLPHGSDSLLTHSLGIGVVLTVSRPYFSPPRWGEVSVLVSYGISRDTAVFSSEMCHLEPRPETLTETSHLCPLAIGLFPGYCTWAFRMMFPN